MRAVPACLILVLVVAPGCRRDEPAQAPAPSPSPSAAGPAAEAVRLVVMQSLAFGKSVDPEGRVTAPADTFAPGEPLFVSLETGPISPGTEVRLAWRGPAGEDLGQEQVTIPPEARVINFKARDTSGWPPGEHRLEVAVGGAPVASKPFRIAGGTSSPTAGAGQH